MYNRDAVNRLVAYIQRFNGIGDKEKLSSLVIDEFKISILHDSVRELKDVSYRLFEEIVGDEADTDAEYPNIEFLKFAADGDIVEFQDGKLARFTVYEGEKYFAFDDRVEKVGTGSETCKHIYTIKRPIYYKYSQSSKPESQSEQEKNIARCLFDAGYIKIRSDGKGNKYLIGDDGETINWNDLFNMAESDYFGKEIFLDRIIEC